MWMIYVLAEDSDTKEFSASVIAATFNKHFKSFGTILAQNVLRDLGKEKVRSDCRQQRCFTGPDEVVSPRRWQEADPIIGRGSQAEARW